jgi:hypothetical protein
MFPNPLIGEAGTPATSWLIAAGGHIGFGVGLFYAIKKFFEEVEKSLNEDTKLEIAVRVLDVNPTKSIRSWQSTFFTMFNTVFGKKHWTWRCFWRSCLFTGFVTLTFILGRTLMSPQSVHPVHDVAALVLSGFIGSLLPDYLSLWKTRYLMEVHRKHDDASLGISLIILDLFATCFFAFIALDIGMQVLPWLFYYPTLPTEKHGLYWDHFGRRHLLFSFYGIRSDDPFLPLEVWFIPAFFGRLWLFGYVTCGLLLNFSRRLDFGFNRFTRHFDMEKHALQSIGVVAGSLTALGYWFLAIIHLVP